LLFLLLFLTAFLDKPEVLIQNAIQSTMYSAKNYINRGFTFLNNKFFPGRKKLSTLAFIVTDLCDSACKHCLIWAKRPVNYFPLEKIKEVMNSKCVTRNTTVALQGGEFLLHPEAMDIMKWFNKNHPNVDILTNALKPESVIEIVDKNPPRRLFISIDGDKDSYLNMRGKDGYEGIINVIEKTHKKVPVSAMFTLSPYNDFNDLDHVANVCTKYDIDLRIGVYNDISFFDTIESAHSNDIGSLKSNEILSFSKAKELLNRKPVNGEIPLSLPSVQSNLINIRERLPEIIKKFPENYEYLVLYDEWRRGQLNLSCNSILDSLIVLPNGDVPVCQNLNVMTGNLFINTLDEIFNGAESQKTQKHYSKNCNACFINFHRKYDIALYRNFERFFGKYATSKLLGYYWWSSEKKKTYKQIFKS